MISPEVQRVSISDYAAARGYEVAGWLEGLDESGSRARSAWWPRLDQAVAAVETGEYEVLLVWKFSRVARHRLRWAVAIDRVEEAGGRLESATEQFDTTTSSGRLARGMLAELQAFEAERIGEVWKEVHSRRVASGRPASGKPKFGYRYAAASKLHVPDEETGPVLAGLYRRYVAGESVYQLVRWLNAHGWRTSQGGLWSDRSLRRVMDSGFASGRFLVAGQLHQGVHVPLIDDALWQAYLDARAVRRARPARTERSQYLLSGMIRCARCGGSMVAGQYGHAHAPKYRCKLAKEQGPVACTGGYVMAVYVEREVFVWLQARAGRVDAARHDAAASKAHRVTMRREAQRVARELGRADEALRRLAVQHAKNPLPDQVYRGARDELVGQRAGLVAALEEAERAERVADVDVRAVALSLVEGWEEWPVSVRREALAQLVDHVRVTTGRPRAGVEVVRRWDV